MHACPLCHAVHRVTLYRGTRSGDVQRCTACGFVYADPRGPADAASPPAFTDDPSTYLENARHRLGLLARHTGVQNGRLVDVGCYDGAFLLAAQELGFDVEGVEPSAAGAAKATERGLRVTESTFADAPLTGPFDAVTFVHSLEHFEDPRAALARARDLLRPGGAVLVEAPNFDAWSRRLTGRRWRQLITDHFHFFEPPTLRDCLEEAGLDVAFLAPVGKVASVALLADRIGRYYSAAAGRALSRAADKTGVAQRQLSLNFGDILLAVATRPTRG